ncbi:MAG: hypothetical protein OSJ45_11865 [Lachnospiraceae bacterium]|nr:hypothetical protein [Lachnospiraceae bacterium]
MEKPGVDKIIVFLIIALLPVFALTIIPKILLGIFQSNIDSLLSDGFYKASIITAAVIFVIILILSAYIAIQPYIGWGIAYVCGMLYGILLFVKPGEEFNSLNFYIIVISYAIDFAVLIALSLIKKK